MSQPRNRNISNWSSLNSEIDFIHRQLSKAVNPISTITFVSGGGGGSGSIAVPNNIRVGIGFLTANTTKHVNFAKPLSFTPALVIVLISYTDTTQGGAFTRAINPTTTGFDIAGTEILFDGSYAYAALAAD
jgi:hypothetical protein